jgi:predicted PhzF superfamily epimerase YddE/YHI9
VAELHVLRVFVNEEGEWGNRLGVFLDGGVVGESARQSIAAELGFSETVFVEDRADGRACIHTPAVELPFAGHPAVGMAWLLAKTGTPVTALHLPAGEVTVRAEADHTYIGARPEWAPPFDYRRLDSPAEVTALEPLESFGPPGPALGGGGTSERNVYAWAWIDEAAGTIRARSFVPEAGIVEDEATGSAALGLCARLGRPVTIHQGHGSVLVTRLAAEDRCEVGGRVSLDEVREHPLND